MKRNEKWIDNEIGVEGAKSISESLKINTSLTKLDLSCDEKKRYEMKERRERKERKINRQQYRRWRSKDNKWNIKD